MPPKSEASLTDHLVFFVIRLNAWLAPPPWLSTSHVDWAKLRASPSGTMMPFSFRPLRNAWSN